MTGIAEFKEIKQIQVSSQEESKSDKWGKGSDRWDRLPTEIS